MTSWPIKNETLELVRKFEAMTGKKQDEITKEALKDYFKSFGKSFVCPKCDGEGVIEFPSPINYEDGKELGKLFESIVILFGGNFPETYHEAIRVYCVKEAEK